MIASVDTYLRFAEAVNRLDLNESGETLPELVEDLGESGAKSKTQGVLEGAKEKLFGEGDEDEEESSSSSRRTSSGSSRGRAKQRASSRGRQSSGS